MCRSTDLSPAFALAASLVLLGDAPAGASHDPSRTATIYVQGFESDGAGRQGVFGDDVQLPFVAAVGSLFGLPTTDQPGAASRPNVLAATTFYGDTAPAYYAAADRSEIAAVTANWGGGVPRYALIVAKYARHLMQRTGAEQVNFISASFGSLVVRWLVEKDLGGLASDGKIARWMSAEGVLAGNWAASRGELVDLWTRLGASTLDVHHMDYGWIESNLHAPRDAVESSLYADILLGQIGSTNDVSGGEALTALMFAYDQFQPNDGVQALRDAVLQQLAPAARYLGLPPVVATFHADHLGLADHRGAWLQAAAFVTQRRRVTVTLTLAQVTDVHEPHAPLWNWMPAEVVFESRAYSPSAQARWGIDAVRSEVGAAGAAAPLRRYGTVGETMQIDQLVFDGFVFPQEDELRLELAAKEIDFDVRYRVAETIQQPSVDDLGAVSLFVPLGAPGTYAVQAASWNGVVQVRVTEYPFELPTDTQGIGSGVGRDLHLDPNPFSASLRVTVRDANRFGGVEGGVLEIYDVGGRRVRRIPGSLRAGFVWDGRSEEDRRLPAGLYLQRLVAGPHTLFAKALLVR
jgi:hypothetical protein